MAEFPPQFKPGDVALLPSVPPGYLIIGNDTNTLDSISPAALGASMGWGSTGGSTGQIPFVSGSAFGYDSGLVWDNTKKAVSLTRTVLSDLALTNVVMSVTGDRSGKGNMNPPPVYGGGPTPFNITLAHAALFKCADSTHVPSVPVNGVGLASTTVGIQTTFGSAYNSVGSALAIYVDDVRTAASPIESDGSGIQLTMASNPTVISYQMGMHGFITRGNTFAKTSGIWLQMLNHGNDTEIHGFVAEFSDFSDTLVPSFTAGAAFRVGALSNAPPGTQEGWTYAFQLTTASQGHVGSRNRYLVYNSGKVEISPDTGFTGNMLKMGVNGVTAWYVDQAGMTGMSGLGIGELATVSSGIVQQLSNDSFTAYRVKISGTSSGGKYLDLQNAAGSVSFFTVDLTGAITKIANFTNFAMVLQDSNTNPTITFGAANTYLKYIPGGGLPGFYLQQAGTPSFGVSPTFVGFAALAGSGSEVTSATSAGNVFRTSIAPGQITTAQAGNTASVLASNAVAGSSVAGAAAGGSVVVTAGNAARLTSGSAVGGSISLTLGVGIGGGADGAFNIIRGSTLFKVDSTGAIVSTLAANNITGLLIKRFTDTTPTGNYLDFQKVAGSATVFSLGVTGNIIMNLDANGITGILMKRLTDSGPSPTGYFIECQTHAGGDTFYVDILGQVAAPTLALNEVAHSVGGGIRMTAAADPAGGMTFIRAKRFTDSPLALSRFLSLQKAADTTEIYAVDQAGQGRMQSLALNEAIHTVGGGIRATMQTNGNTMLRFIRATDSGNNGFFMLFQNAAATTFVFAMDDFGRVGIGGITTWDANYYLQLPNDATKKAKANAWDTYSDARVKRQVVDLEDGLEVALRLRPVRADHHFSSFENGRLSVRDEYRRTVGFIAQEAYEHAPEAVTRGEGDELWGMDYSRMTPYLVSAVKTLHARIAEIEGRGARN